MPEPEPPRKMMPSRRIQSRIDSIESSIERMKHAEHCGFSSKPTLNQTGRVERRVLVDEDRLQLGLERLGLLVGREVAALAAPVGDRVGDAADHLLDAALALGRGHAARGSTSARRCSSRSATRTSGTRRPSARRQARPCPGSARRAVSHSISSNGSRPGIVKYRGDATLASSSRTLLTYSCSSGACVACFAVAIMLSSRAECRVHSSIPNCSAPGAWRRVLRADRAC